MSAFASPETWLMIGLVVPYIGAILIPLFRNTPNLREGVTLMTAAALLVSVLGLVGPVLDGDRPEAGGIEVLPGIAFAFKVEPLGMLFGLIASSLWIVNSIYSIGYMRGNSEPRQTSYYVCFAIALASTIGVAFAKNLFTMFIFYELLTLSTYPLVAHRRDVEALRSGRLYLVMLLGTSTVLFLPAIVMTWVFADTLDFTPGGILGGTASAGALTVLLALYVFGIGKAAVMPLHSWLPAAMVAPTPVSALLHAVAVVKAGVFCVTKVAVMIFGVETLQATGQSGWLTIVAGTTIILASLMALKQDNLKRRLAYSTISQLSYVVLGVAILAPISVAGAAIHIAAHALCKITLFFAAGSIYTAANLTEISQLDGIGRRMPWTMTAFAIGALGMIGVPPTAGFIGKWFMLTGAMQTENWFAVAVMIVSTLLNAAYFLPIVARAFFREAPAGNSIAGMHHAHGEAPWTMVVPLMATAAGAVLLFFFPDVPLTLSRMMLER
jgi:multicomponent Na+:H+ antiporter subunit D